jgi:Leucine-rich repeat (LRR) protein
MASMEQTKPRRRWLKFSLGGLLLAITLLCLLLGWYAESVARQRRAVERLEQLDATVYYDYQRKTSSAAGAHDPRLGPPGPAWLHSLVGADWFGTVDMVLHFGHFDENGTPAEKMTSQDVALLEDLPQLEALLFNKVPTTDADIAHVASLRDLQYLDINGAQLSDAGLEQLARLQKLETLELGGPDASAAPDPITDEGLRHLLNLVHLKHLALGPTQATEAGLSQLMALEEMEDFEIGLSPGTEVRLAWLDQWPKLESLALRSGTLTVEACEQLAKCRLMTSLELQDATVSDEGLEKLAALPLTTLYLNNTPISGQCLPHLQKVVSLSVSNTKLTGTFLKFLEGMPNLGILDLTYCTVAEGALTDLPVLPNVHMLNLTRTPASDSDVVNLATKLPSLDYLVLDGTQLTDHGLNSLAIPTLKVVSVTKTHVTTAGAKKFVNATGAEVHSDVE